MHSQLYPLLYQSFWVLFIFFEFLCNCWVYLNHKLVDFYHVYSVSDDCKYVNNNIRKINKIPVHLTILLCSEKPSYTDLANIIVWSIASGISFISLYDSKGILKNSEEKLEAEVEKRKLPCDHVLWYDGQNSYKNGFTGRKIRVRTLSPTHGRVHVSDVVKQLSRNQISTINQETIESNLKDRYVFPDPDLGFYCGGVLSMYGYPPWEIRTTEFLPIRSHYNITAHSFVKALYRYSKTEQRLGK